MTASRAASPRAIIFGCGGHELSREERAFFRRTRPLGFILFKRNIDNPEQVARLCKALRASIGDLLAPILVDQEGGRVQRFGPPHWRPYPNAATYGRIWETSPDRAREAAFLGSRLMADDLRACGVTVDCLPVLDVPVEGAHDVIGNRAYSRDPSIVASLGRAACLGLMAGGVLPVVKHMPGHGRANADTHFDLPRIDASLDELRASDFRPFRALNDMPLGMTAHVVLSAVDKQRPATQSPRVIADIVRGHIGFDGFLMSDDLSMKALKGDFGARAAAVLAAGCDAVLHCNGDMAEMQAAAEGVAPLSTASLRRLSAAIRLVSGQYAKIDRGQASGRFDELLALAG